jgi:hypothetical protein
VRVHIQGEEIKSTGLNGFMKFVVRTYASGWEETWKILNKHKTVLSSTLKHKITPYRSTPAHLSGLPKIHKPDISLRPIVISIDSPCYAVADFLHKILGTLVGNTDSFVKNPERFIKQI